VNQFADEDGKGDKLCLRRKRAHRYQKSRGAIPPRKKQKTDRQKPIRFLVASISANGIELFSYKWSVGVIIKLF